MSPPQGGQYIRLDTVPNNLDLMAGCKLAEMAVNLAGGADLIQFFPALCIAATISWLSWARARL